MSNQSQQVTEEQVLEALKRVKFPGLSRDIVSFGMIKGMEIKQGVVALKVEVTSRDSNVPQQIEDDVAKAVRALPGVSEVRVEMKWTQPQTKAPHGHGGQPAEPEKPILTQVRCKIAVASGKGGVGKSTVAAGLALMLQRKGLSVGLVDFDVYGPSVPTILGVHSRPMVRDNKIVPLDRQGLKLMSMGFLVDDDTPMIWRGPMVHQAVEQFLRDVDWGMMDVLIVDLPPGTGDAQMTLSQKIQLDGAVIVTTPQNLALIDARKGVGMFQKMDVPILGIVENMAEFCCPNCNHTTPIFGQGGGAAEAERLGVPLLGSLPLVPELVLAADAGDPLSVIESHPKLSENYRAMADTISERIGAATSAQLQPRT